MHMRSRTTLILILLTSVILACTDKKHQEFIIGHWTGVDWKVENQPSQYSAGDASFTFDANGNYSFDYAGSGEKGIYSISNNQLFTTPEGGIKMMVKVITLTPDTLILDMNRGGQAEQITLVKK